MLIPLSRCERLHQSAPRARHVRRDHEQPTTHALGLVHDRPRERLLREVLCALDVPHLAVQESHQRGEGGAVDLGQVLWHTLVRNAECGVRSRRVSFGPDLRRSTPHSALLTPHLSYPRNSLTSRSSSPSCQVFLPPGSILMLTRRPATRTAGSSAAGLTSSGNARSSAK